MEVDGSMSGGDVLYFPEVTSETPQDQDYGIINGQANLPYANELIGWFGSYGKSGCTYIAIYNAMQLIGQRPSLQSVVDEVYPVAGMLYGAWGAEPTGITTYMNNHNIEYTEAISADMLISDISNGEVIVFVILNNRKDISKGWHAITAKYYDGNYYVFNRYNNDTTYRTYESFSDIYGSGGFLYGVRIG